MRTKHVRKELARLQNRLAFARNRIDARDKVIEDLKQRFREIGSSEGIETIESNGAVISIKKVRPLPFGTYKFIDEERSIIDLHTAYQNNKKELLEMVAEGLLEENVVQIIFKDRDLAGPLGMNPTMAIKMYVVPWEKMTKKGELYIQF